MSSATLEKDPKTGPLSATGTQEYLTFVLDGQEYGVDILRVQEIRGYESVTRVPNVPKYIKGVLNLRGTIVPIFDLRCRFELEEVAYDRTTVIVVLQVNTGDSKRIMGVVVDAVSDVCNLSNGEVQAAPDFGSRVKTDFIRGMATRNERLVILLEIDRLLSNEERSVLEKLSE